ncbi:MAG: aspartate aminotransferase family protein [Bacteroidetes bacterium]|nr:aspartate aminotransferase family protein [Bacteroidota bacterium]HET6243944.1 aspartate aminotransferase family protein [Bacteroidia bacterium]
MVSQRQLFLNHLAQTSPAPIGLEIVKAQGLYLEDFSGKKYMDLISGISVSNIGHRHPKVLAAIQDQLDKYLYLMVYGEYVQSPQVVYAKMLTNLLPFSLNTVYFTNSGSEANEGALKLAKRFTGRSEIIAFKNAYHGSTQGALSVMGNETFKNAFRPLLPGIRFLEFNNSADLEIITTNTACVIVEPVQGEAGIIVPNNDFLKKLRNKCNETGTLLIFDEIQTGFGRTGSLFAFEQFDVVPDLLTIAKGMGGGMPIGAFVASNEIMKSLSENPVLGHITTFGGHPVSCAAAKACLEVLIEEELIQQVKEKEIQFRELLIHPKIKSIRSLGLMIALEFDDFEFNKKVIDLCIEKGIITDWFLFCDNSMRIAPPLSITKKEIIEACTVILKSIEESV